MSVEAVVKKDFRDGIRSKLLWALVALFVVVLGGVSLLATQTTNQASGEAANALVALLGFSILLTISVLVPLTGLAVSIKSIVRERELGSIKILLSLPHDRSEIVLGKFLGRAGLLTTAILAGFVPSGIVYLVRIDEFPLTEYLFLTVVTVLLGLQFVAIGVGVSALLETETQATVAGVGIFFTMLFWRRIFGFVNGQLDLLSGDALLFVERFHLWSLFTDMQRALISLTEDLPSNASSVVGPDAQMVVGEGGLEVASQPFYLQHWFAFVLLALWIVVPLAIGYYRFENADL